MKRALFAIFLGAASVPTQAAITVSDCVIREPAPGSDKTALYFSAVYQPNEETAALRLPNPESLFGAIVPELTDYTELHDMKHVDGVMTMHRIPQIPLKPKQSITLKPGGKHVMLFNLKKRPVAGEIYPVELLVAFDPEVKCNAVVKTSAQIKAGQ
ncbi:copper chaperone PCu(A)C [Enterovibrio paralichthyis]|uniref:copper chaperone PCu(A)C n=1 Tax=Enterovibrio paralichthyis TaxID=2853805 RepID=UPI001C468547|nr:copper chaperone PCu(A)C [Enterovibrio paralichthyis]MBV7300206.1 copper chaperone PCu(A)C [Enterovibrio paralichthyis]